MKLSLMPLGVEHTLRNEQLKEINIMKLSLMPLGVEHETSAGHIAVCDGK